jgi:hypothetical protein
MAGPSIDKIRVNALDASGNTVLCIYAKKTPEYAVYHDPARVMVQFADNPSHARDQRASLSQLNALRGQISGLIDGWHESEDAEKAARAKRYDRRVADAIITGFERRIPDALALLTEIRDDIIAERKSIAQTDYLVVAAIAGVLLLSATGIFGALGSIDGQPAHCGLIWTGAVGGVLGAFFSIATGLRSKSILIDLQRWDNRRDAILRMAVGTIAGGVLLSLLLTNMASISHIDRGSLTATAANAVEPILLAFILGFIGGFSERAVPGLLSRASLSVENTDDVAARQARAVGMTGQPATLNKATRSSDSASEDRTPPGPAARNGKSGQPNTKGGLARTLRETKPHFGKQGLGTVGEEKTPKNPADPEVSPEAGG